MLSYVRLARGLQLAAQLRQAASGLGSGHLHLDQQRPATAQRHEVDPVFSRFVSRPAQHRREDQLDFPVTPQDLPDEQLKRDPASSRPAAVVRAVAERGHGIFITAAVHSPHPQTPNPWTPSTGNLILGNTDGTVTLLKESTGTQTEIPVADNTVNSFALGIGVNTVTGNIYVTDEGGPGHDSTISVISQQTHSVTGSIDNPNTAEAVAVDPGTGTVYISTLWTDNSTVLSGQVLVIKERTNKVVRTITNVGDLPYRMPFDPVSRDLVAANYFQDSLAIISTKTGKVTQVAFPSGFHPDNPAVDPVNGMVYTDNFGGGAVWVVSEKAKALVATIAIPDGWGHRRRPDPGPRVRRLRISRQWKPGGHPSRPALTLRRGRSTSPIPPKPQRYIAGPPEVNRYAQPACLWPACDPL